MELRHHIGVFLILLIAAYLRYFFSRYLNFKFNKYIPLFATILTFVVIEAVYWIFVLCFL